LKLPLYQVDAFAGNLFAGNPAAVCPVETWPDDSVMQAIAAENNLAETAFLAPEGDGYRLRWFTPELEIDLCGHATVASAFVLRECLGYSGDRIRFFTRSGELGVDFDGELYALDFPSRPPVECPPVPGLEAALGTPSDWLGKSRDHLVLYGSEDAVRALTPDFTALDRTDVFALIATAPGSDCDFVSRFFAPRAGINEDPVTGSAHCTLIPFWAERLGKEKLFARQVSRRGGELWCELRGDRVRIAGRAVLYLEGSIRLP
jgi:predicted PhzF superfamily epimerase YddE/YHI9